MRSATPAHGVPILAPVAGPWRWLHSSVRGSAHVENGLPCQDAAAAAQFARPGGGTVLVLVAADGAGSARCAERGSRLVSDGLVAAVGRWAAAGGDIAGVDAECAGGWLAEVQGALGAAAGAAGDVPRDWASTLIAAVISEGRAVFMQIGDGAVIADGVEVTMPAAATALSSSALSSSAPSPTAPPAADPAAARPPAAPATAAPSPVPDPPTPLPPAENPGPSTPPRAGDAQAEDAAAIRRPPAAAPGPGPWSPVFWPEAGVYANCTFFVSDADAAAHLRFAVRTGVTEVALFSDGLHAVALHHASRSAFAPFFRPLFARLRREPGGAAEGLVAALAELLDSPGVRKRADDDRTLVLASRLSG